MRFLALALLAATGAVAQTALTLPSGGVATPFDLIEEERVVRLRYIGAGLAQDVNAYQTQPLRLFQDMKFLCDSHHANRGLDDGTDVIVTMMDQPVAFGVVDPSVTQYFEAFTIRAGECVFDDAEFLD